MADNDTMQTGSSVGDHVTEILGALAALVVKQGVGIGGLTQAQRELALAVPALALAPGVTCTEGDINELLVATLAAEAAYLRTDHVELRRWLIDMGWWRRDGFGRSYERTPATVLRQPLATIEATLSGLDLPRWVKQQQDAARGARANKQAAWAARAHAAGAGSLG